MKQYNELLDRVLTNGRETDDRTGVGTVSVFGERIDFDLQESFPIVTSRKIAYKQAIGELCGFLHGATTKEEFTDLGCTYWNTTNGNLDDLGPIYGAQWLNFNGFNQMRYLEHNLKATPTSRRHILSTWNPNQINDMCLPPCHILTQFEVRDDYLDCIVYMRSVDLCLGLPYDIVVYAALTEVLAKRQGLVGGRLTFLLGNTHIYKNHIMDAIRMLKLETLESSSKLTLGNVNGSLMHVMPEDFLVNYYTCHESEFSFALNL